MNNVHKRILELVTHVIDNDPMSKHLQSLGALESIQHIIGTCEQIKLYQHKGKIKVSESGMDCDCVKYSGREHVIDANLEAFEKLHDGIADYADGPFTLHIVPWDLNIQYTSRDLALEAYENGHPHHITFDGS